MQGKSKGIKMLSNCNSATRGFGDGGNESGAKPEIPHDRSADDGCNALFNCSDQKTSIEPRTAIINPSWGRLDQDTRYISRVILV